MIQKRFKRFLVCAVTAAAVSAASHRALADDPRIWIQSSAKAPKIGDTVVLTAQTSGVDDPDLQYQWLEGTREGGDWRAVAGETGKQYRFVYDEAHESRVWRVRLLEAPAQPDAAPQEEARQAPAAEPDGQPQPEPTPGEAGAEQPPADGQPHAATPPPAGDEASPEDAEPAAEPPAAEEPGAEAAEKTDKPDAPSAAEAKPESAEIAIHDDAVPLGAGVDMALTPATTDNAAPMEGDLLTLTPATPPGEAVNAQYQWFVDKADGQGYQPVPGQTRPTLRYRYTEAQSHFHWRVLIRTP